MLDLLKVRKLSHVKVLLNLFTTKLMVTLSMKGRNMCVNTMDVISMVAKHAFHTIEIHI